MYSRAYSDRRYGAIYGGDEQITVPPRYGGVRFVKTSRSDGRGGSYERSVVPMAKVHHEGEASKTENTEVINEAEEVSSVPLENEVIVPEVSEKRKNPLSEILKNVGEDDILIIALILIIAAEKSENSREAILLLALLLCFR